MSSFTSRPVVYLPTDDSGNIELFSSFTYYREPIRKKDGTIKQPSEYTKEERKYRSFESIVVPKGFKSDGATVPKAFTWMYPKVGGRYTKAAILHDYMYENAIGSKKEADIVFEEALHVLGCSKATIKIFMLGVKLIGKGNYK